MNALQPSRYPQQPQQPLDKRRLTPRPKRRLRQRSHQIMVLETTAKIGVNLVITAAAISALTQLLPYHWSQQEKLREINTEVKLMEGRVNKLQKEFGRNFDPRQAKSLMEEQGYRFDPNQRRVIFPKDLNQEKSESPLN
jgi:trimethylamine:corrinoid methyltransferase-like protein